MTIESHGGLFYLVLLSQALYIEVTMSGDKPASAPVSTSAHLESRHDKRKASGRIIKETRV